MRRNSPFILILIAVVALVLFGYANNAAFMSTHPDYNAQNAAAQSQKAPDNKPATPPPGSADSTALIPEMTVGNPATAKQRVTLGFTIDENLEQHPEAEKLFVSDLQNFVTAHPNMSLQVVCVDIPADQRTDPSTTNVPLGLSVNGKPVPGMNRNIASGLDTHSVMGYLSSHP